MSSSSLLFITDAPESANLWVSILTQQGLNTTTVNVENASDQLLNISYDLILIDRHSSENILDFMEQFKIQAETPVLLFAYEADERHILSAYDQGVSDYIVKPISPQVFLAKVNSWLRYSRTSFLVNSECITAGDFQLSVKRHELLNSKGIKVKLTKLEFRLLWLLMAHPGQIVSVAIITHRVWGYTDEDPSLVKNLVYRMRHKIEPNPNDPQYIHSIPGEGYLFQP